MTNTHNVQYSASGNLMLLSGGSSKQYYFRLEDEMLLRYYLDRDQAKQGRKPFGEINLLKVGEFKPYNKPVRINSNIYFVIHLTGSGKGQPGWTFGVHGAGKLIVWIKALHRACCLPAVKYCIDTKQHIWAVDHLPDRSNPGESALDAVRSPNRTKGEIITLVVPAARLYLPGGLEAIVEVTFNSGPLGLRLCTTRAGTAVHHVDTGGQSEARGVQIGDLVLTVGDVATAGMAWRDVYEVIASVRRPMLVSFGKGKIVSKGNAKQLQLPSNELTPDKKIGVDHGAATKERGNRKPSHHRDHARGKAEKPHNPSPNPGSAPSPTNRFRRSLQSKLRSPFTGKKKYEGSNDSSSKSSDKPSGKGRGGGGGGGKKDSPSRLQQQYEKSSPKHPLLKNNAPKSPRNGPSKVTNTKQASKNPIFTRSKLRDAESAKAKHGGVKMTTLAASKNNPHVQSMTYDRDERKDHQLRSINLNMYQNKSKSVIRRQLPRWKITASAAYQGVGNVRKFGDLDFKLGKGFKIGKKPWLRRQVVLRDNGLFFQDSMGPSTNVRASSVAQERILFADFVLPGGKAAEPIPKMLCSYIGKEHAFTVHTASHIYAFSASDKALEQSWIKAIVDAYNDFLQQQQKLIFSEQLAGQKALMEAAWHIADKNPDVWPLVSKMHDKSIQCSGDVRGKLLHLLNRDFEKELAKVYRRNRMQTSFLLWQAFVKINKLNKKRGKKR